jgi:hypothetical protein
VPKSGLVTVPSFVDLNAQPLGANSPSTESIAQTRPRSASKVAILDGLLVPSFQLNAGARPRSSSGTGVRKGRSESGSGFVEVGSRQRANGNDHAGSNVKGEKGKVELREARDHPVDGDMDESPEGDGPRYDATGE